MGATFQTQKFADSTKEHLKTRWEKMIKSLLYEEGHKSYNGTFTTCSGLSILDRKFDSLEKAEDWLAENTEKWEDAKAVRVNKGGKTIWLIGGWCAE